MPEFLSAAFFKRSARTLLDIRRGPLPAPLKLAVRRAMLRLDRRGLRKRKTVPFLKFSLSFHGEHNLRSLIQEIFGRGVYFFETQNSAPTIIDCGSNIGISVLFFKWLYPNARIISFEPDPATFSVLNTNIRANNLADISTHQVALGTKNGITDFYRDADPCSSSLMMSTNPQRHGGSRLSVPLRKLSDFIQTEVDLLKIDVEGAEFEIINDLIASDKLRRVKQMHLEYHHHIGSAPGILSIMLRSLEEAGFDYQLQADRSPPGSFQDISVHCYRRNN